MGIRKKQHIRSTSMMIGIALFTILGAFATFAQTHRRGGFGSSAAYDIMMNENGDRAFSSSPLNYQSDYISNKSILKRRSYYPALANVNLRKSGKKLEG